jgi:hypothetical protein
MTFAVWGGQTTRERQNLSQEPDRVKRTVFAWTPEASLFLCASVMAERPYTDIADELGTSEMSVRKRVGVERKAGNL